VQAIQGFVYIDKKQGFQRNTLLNFFYLNHWYNQKKLNIDTLKAKKYAYLLMKKKITLGYESWDINRNKWSKKRDDFCKKFPKTQYKAILYNIDSIVIHDCKAKIDTKVHRLHSVITNMQKDYRNFLTYNGQQLVSVDIKNSQPYLMCLLFNSLFWQINSEIPLKISTLPNNIRALFNSDKLIALREYIVDNLGDMELSIYKEKASNGIIYEYIRDTANERMGTDLERKNVKTMVLIVFFSKNGFFHQKGAELKRLFAELYPKIYRLIELIKSENHAAFACLLQSIESEIILHRCCKRIWEEKNHQIPIFTIHDSIVTTVEHQDYVKRVMEQILTECIGVKPSLSIEAWHVSNLQEEKYLPALIK
jgi:hypothetical protein